MAPLTCAFLSELDRRTCNQVVGSVGRVPGLGTDGVLERSLTSFLTRKGAFAQTTLKKRANLNLAVTPHLHRQIDTCLKWHFRGWGNNSGVKIFVSQAKGPEFGSPDPT